FFFQAEDGIRDRNVTGVQTCALPISSSPWRYRVPRSQVPPDSFAQPCTSPSSTATFPPATTVSATEASADVPSRLSSSNGNRNVLASKSGYSSFESEGTKAQSCTTRIVR